MSNKLRKILSTDFLEFLEKTESERGQSVVEFVLLLLVIMGFSMLFLALTNRNLSTYWRYLVKIVVDDPTQQLNL